MSKIPIHLLDKIGLHVNVKLLILERTVFEAEGILIGLDLGTNKFILKVIKSNTRGDYCWAWGIVGPNHTWAVIRECVDTNPEQRYRLINNEDIVSIKGLPESMLPKITNDFLNQLLRARVAATHEQRTNGLDV